MDNDNILLQKAADIYRGLRFKMKYRGVDILPAGAGNDLARELLESGQPFLFGRCGATEMRTVADYLQNGGKDFDDRTREDIRNLSGVFPTDDATLEKFCRIYVKYAQNAELLALWNVGAEREVIRGCDATRFTELRALEPYYHTRPWSAALAGKRVLVVDDVISTGGSLKALDALAEQTQCTIVGQAAVLAEGDAAERKDIIFLEPLPLFFH